MTRDEMEILAFKAVVQILHEDLAKALAGDEYRALAARQFAMDAAHRAFTIFPELRLEEAA